MALECSRIDFKNPVNVDALPQEPLRSQWPVRDRLPRRHALRISLLLCGAIIAPMLLQNGFLWTYLALDSPSLTVFWMFLLIYVVILPLLTQMRNGSWFYLATIACSFALMKIPIGISLLLLPLLLIYAVRKFRHHYLEYCIATPLKRSVAQQFRKHGTLPAGAKLVPILKDFGNAITSWFGYNYKNHKLPGIWQSPAGSQITRLALTVFTLLLLSTTVSPIVFLLIGDQPLDVGSLSPQMAVLAYSLPSLGLLLACFLGSLSMLGKAGGLRNSATLPKQWGPLLQDLANSPNMHEQESLYMGHVVADNSPILNPLKTVGQHLWISGSTGSQKTTTLLFLLEQLIHRGHSVICLDLKADSFELLQTLIKATRSINKHNDAWHFTIRHGWATQLCSPFAQSFWNNISPSERTDIHLASMGLGFTRDYGESWFSDASYQVLDFVNEKYPDIASYRELEERVVYEMAHARAHELSSSVKKDGEHAGLIIRRLAKVETLNVSPHHPQSARDAALDLSSLFNKQGVAYWGLNSLVAPIVSAEVSRVILATLLASATSLQKKKHNVVLVIDEFQQMVAPGALQLALRQARSLGISIILSNQTVADLKTHKNDFVPAVEGNTATQIWMKGCGRDAIDQIQRLGGKYIDQLRSITTNSEGNHSVTTQEVIVDRFDATTIAKVSSDVGSFLMRITNNDGYAQYNGIPFIARSDYHLEFSEYQRRCSAPWPALGSTSVCVGQNRQSTPTTIPSTSALPAPAPKVRTKNIIGSGTLGGSRP